MATLLPPLAGIAILIVGDPYLDGAVPRPGLVGGAAGLVVVGWLGLCAVLLWRVMRLRDYPGWRCERCGYDRRGLRRGDACPECGAGARQPMMRLAIRHDSRRRT